ncbi:MAG: cytochrome C oxidase subunit IV family protein [Candidatus Promineifilaceae bacterium]|nr:cytochrome C oxidase subunit IV family protein [Candidatus Promineifilaceae bacterium]
MENQSAVESKKQAAYRQGVYVFLGLVLLTALEFGVAVWFDGAAVPLFIIALLKTGLIVQYFMHIYRLWREEEH